LVLLNGFGLYPNMEEEVLSNTIAVVFSAFLVFGYLVSISLVSLNRSSLSINYKYILLILGLFILHSVKEIIAVDINALNVLFNVLEIFALSFLAYLFYVVGYKDILDSASSDLENTKDQLLELSRIDELTLIPNRKFLFENMDKSFRLAKREKHSIAFVMVDIDDFRFYNDIYGISHGDSILRRVARATEKACLRPLDTVGRYGGEEFMAVLPNSDFDGTKVVCERILQNIHDLRIKHYKKSGEFLTVSVGFSIMTPDKEDVYDRGIKKAEEYLNKIKNTGKNAYMGVDLNEGENNYE
jgi:diguanylate cyclase (GGDEF)-like protein